MLPNRGVVLNVERGTVVTDVFYPSLNHFLRIHIGPSTEVSSCYRARISPCIEINVKFTPEQATKAPRGRRGIALLFL